MWIGSACLAGIVLGSSPCYASDVDWTGPGWYAVITVAIGKAVHSGPFASEEACEAGYNANPSNLPDAKMTCIYYKTMDAYMDDMIGDSSN